MNELFLKLIKKYKERLSTSEVIYNKYNTLISNLNSILNNLNETNEIDVSFVSDTETKEFLVFLQQFLKIGNIRNEEEINNKVKEYLLKLENEKNNNEEVKKYNEGLDKLNKVIGIIENDFEGNLDILFDFLYSSYKDNLISLEEYADLNFYITIKKSENSELENSNEVSIVEITENSKIEKENLHQTLINLFKNSEYDYEKFDESIQNQIESFAKVENVSNVIKFLKSYNLSSNDLVTHQIIVSKLFIYYDKKAISEISNFLDNNKVTLNTLLQMGSIFFSRKKDYVIRESSNGSPPWGNNEAPTGSLESFIGNINLYKELLGLPKDYAIKNEDLREKEVFFTTPIEVINKNLNLLSEYNLLSKNSDGSLVDKKSFHKNSICFSGRNVEYVIDRCIESGLYEYIQKYKTILRKSDFPLTWYKIKRANDLNEDLLAHNKGLKTIFSDDTRSYGGIIRVRDKDGNLNGIKQNYMSMEDLVKGKRRYPIITYNDPEEYAKKEFIHFYKYSVCKPTDVIGLFRNISSTTKEKLKSINDILENYYSRDKKISKDIFTDEVISVLENSSNISDNTTVSKSSDGMAYRLTLVSSEWPKVELTISRLKVLKICSLLRENNLWTTNKSGIDEISSLIFVLISKDTILSEAEVESLKRISFNIAKKVCNERERNSYKGVRRWLILWRNLG